MTMPAPNGHDTAAAERIARALGGASRSGEGWMCKCPVPGHGGGGGDKNASLWLVAGDKLTVVPTCQAGCKPAEVLAELERRGHIEPRRSVPPQRSRLVATYTYPAADGRTAYLKRRYEPGQNGKKKSFSLHKPDGSPGIKGIPRVLYNLPEVLTAEEVYVCEGEKDADNLAKLGLVTTTNVEGASDDVQKPKWLPDYSRVLAKVPKLVFLPHNDGPGRAHMQHAAKSCRRQGAQSIRVLELPDLAEKGDVSDWLERGNGLPELGALLAGTPEWQPRAPAGDAPAGDAPEPAGDAHARPSPAPARDGWTAELLTHGERYAKNDHNILVALRTAPELRGRFRLNLLAGTIEASDMPWRPGSGWLAWGDPDNHRLAAWLQKRGIDVRPTQVAGNVGTVADETRHDPVKDYLLSLRWEGAERLSSWLVTHLGAHDAPAEYLKGVARAWMIAMVARALEPGCKADHILILEGPQGRLKSSALKALMPDEAWFSDEISTLGTKDSAQDLRGKWLIELSELSAMQRAEVERTKAALSRCVDHYRPSFGHYSRDFPRRNGFAGSTNHDAYLLDDTGNRRIWGVKVGTILLDALERDRDQLWAEAVRAYQAGERWWLDPAVESHAAAEQAKRLEEDSWTHDVVTWGATQLQPFSANDALLKALHLVDASKRDDKATKRVVRILRTNGFTPHRTETARLWSRPAPDTAPEPSGATVMQKPLDINAPDGMTVMTPENTRAPAHVSARVTRAGAHPGDPSKTGVRTVIPSAALKTNEKTLSAPADGSDPVSAAWAADWPTWDGRCGADPAAIREWIALAGGTSAGRLATLPASCREHPAALKRLLSHITLQAWKVDWT
jgi:predicted P-loop ATPase